MFKSQLSSIVLNDDTLVRFEPFVGPGLARLFGPAVGTSWLGSALFPAVLAYTTVKAVGWFDWGDDGLNELELKMNGLEKKVANPVS